MEATQFVMVPLEGLNNLMEKVSNIETLLRDIRRTQNNKPTEPIPIEGYYTGKHIARVLNWSDSAWGRMEYRITSYNVCYTKLLRCTP